MQPKILVNTSREGLEAEIWETLKASKITSSNPDLLVLEEDKIGIKEIKQLINHLSTKPFGNTPKSAIILNGDNISTDGQNALLKILEEPPGDSIILIGVNSETKLLPTVVSRCLVITSPQTSTTNSSFDLEKILASSIEERFALIEKTDDKKKLLNDLSESYRSKILKGEGNNEFLEDLLNVQSWKESNVNIRAIAEYLMLRLPKQ